MNRKPTLLGLICVTLLMAADQVIFADAAAATTPTSFEQQDKETLFKEFNEKKRSNIEEAYKLAQGYLERYGNDQDDNTKYVKEWVIAYRAVRSQTPADAKPSENPTPAPNKPHAGAAANPLKPLDINGTTWQIKGKENGRPWATIFAFKPGGRFQRERYGVDGSSSIAAGTWRQLDESVFATLLGADGNPAGTIRAEVNGGCLVVLKTSGEVDSLMETDSVLDGCKDQKEAARKAQEAKLEADRKAAEARRLQAEKELAESRARDERTPPKFTNPAGIEFVLIRSGKFMMGSNQSPREQPVHEVTISQPFYMGKYEVTQAQWQSVMGKNPSYFKKCGQNCPVEKVSWNDVQTFITKLNSAGGRYVYRLPTEAEWEYAARADTTDDYAGNLDSMAWYGSNSGGTTHPVGTKQPNAWGLYDMHGNVWEWCQDWDDKDYYKSSPPTDPQGPSNGKYRVLRGGAWSFSATYARSAFRIKYGYFSPVGVLPADRDAYYGFRVVAVERTR